MMKGSWKDVIVVDNGNIMKDRQNKRKKIKEKKKKKKRIKEEYYGRAGNENIWSEHLTIRLIGFAGLSLESILGGAPELLGSYSRGNTVEAQGQLYKSGCLTQWHVLNTNPFDPSL